MTETTGPAAAAPSSGPLSGMVVIESGSFVAVPSGSMALAMLGAEVIRFDPIGGAADHHRAPVTSDGTSLYWASLNKAKRSIAVDLRRDEGRDLVRSLITAPGRDRGIFVTNAVGRSWLSYDALRQLRDDVIMVQFTGYPDGSPAVDYTVNWETGFPLITGPAAGPPTVHALPAWDVMAGLYVAMVLLGAERRRVRTGEGEYVSVSLSDIALAVTDNLGYFAELQINGEQRQRSGDFVYGTFVTPFETSDGGQVMVVALTPRQWSDLLDATDTHALIEPIETQLGVSFSDEHARYAHRVLLREILAPWFRRRAASDVLEELGRTRVIASRLQTFRECFESPLVQDNPLFTSTGHPEFGTLLGAGFPAYFARAASRPPPVAPVLGADTEWVLGSVLGLTAHEIDDLHDLGVVTSPSSAERGRG